MTRCTTAKCVLEDSALILTHIESKRNAVVKSNDFNGMWEHESDIE